MAKARVVVGDQSSAEFDQLRKTVNSLLLIIENASATSTDPGMVALGAAITAGVDTGTGLELVGLNPTVAYPGRPGQAKGENLIPLTAKKV